MAEKKLVAGKEGSRSNVPQQQKSPRTGVRNVFKLVDANFPKLSLVGV